MGPGMSGTPGMSELTEQPGMSELTEQPGMSKLTEQPGMSKLAEQPGMSGTSGMSELAGFLAGYGIGAWAAMRLFEEYGDEAAAIVRDDPYILATEPYGADFSTADAIAVDLGFDGDSPERVSAALLFELRHNLGNGHVFIPKDKLIAATDELIGSGRDAIGEALDALRDCGDVVAERVAGVESCYLRRAHRAECYTAARIAEMGKPVPGLEKRGNGAYRADGGGDGGDGDGGGGGGIAYRGNGENGEASGGIGEMIDAIESQHGIKYAKLQKEALELAARHRVLVLTGGPGTGKTTTVRGILMLFDALGLRTVLCAPTGRAAKRLSETCLREASTIHRLLGASLGDEGATVFEHDELHPLKADAVIVDESSMVDIMLISSLLAALKRDGRLVLVGDVDQLPSIGPGRVFADMIRSEAVPVVALTEIFRQAEDSGIVRCAHMVNKGIAPDIGDRYPDFFFMQRRTEEQLAATIAELYAKRLPEKMGMDISQIQVLSPTRKLVAGTKQLNDRLREAVNPAAPQKKEIRHGDAIYRQGDKVMQIRNNYDIIWKSPDGSAEGTGVFNGDVGIIKDADPERGFATVDFGDRLVEYAYEQLAELEPAYAITVHKAQGSEYRAVILAMTSAAPPLLTRCVLYTALTRARDLLVVVGSPEIMAKMAANDRKQRRYSGLRARLAGEMGETGEAGGAGM